MRKIQFFILLLIAFNTAANAQGFRLKEITIDAFNGAEFIPFERYSYYYSAGRGGTYLTQLFPFAPGSIDFDEGYFETFSDPDYLPASKTIKQFNADTNITEEINLLWTGTDYVNFTQEIFEYTGTELTVKYKNTWDGTAWQPLFKNEYYHSGGWLIQKIEYSYEAGIWENSEQYFFAYDVENKLVNVEIEKWFMSGWEDKELYTFIYDGTNILSEVTHQMNFGDGLENNARSIFYYSMGRLSEKTDQLYDGTGWINSKQYVTTFDFDNNLTQFYLNGWNGIAWTDSLFYKFEYEYYTSSTNLNSGQGYSIGPNPAADHIFIDGLISGPVKITDISGKVVHNSYSDLYAEGYMLDIADLAAGIYVLQFSDGQNQQTVQFIKQ